MVPCIFKPRSSNLCMFLLSYICLPERQFDGNFDLPQLFQLPYFANSFLPWKVFALLCTVTPKVTVHTAKLKKQKLYAEIRYSQNRALNFQLVRYFVIDWNCCRCSKFLSHCLSGRLLYERKQVRKLEVLRSRCLGPKKLDKLIIDTENSCPLV